MLGIGKRRQQANRRGRVTDSNVFEAIETLLNVDKPALIVLVERNGNLTLWEDVSSPAAVVRMLRDIADKYEHDQVVGGDSGAPSTSPEGAPAKESTDG